MIASTVTSHPQLSIVSHYLELAYNKNKCWAFCVDYVKWFWIRISTDGYNERVAVFFKSYHYIILVLDIDFNVSCAVFKEFTKEIVKSVLDYNNTTWGGVMYSIITVFGVVEDHLSPQGKSVMLLPQPKWYCHTAYHTKIALFFISYILIVVFHFKLNHMRKNRYSGVYLISNITV